MGGYVYKIYLYNTQHRIGLYACVSIYSYYAFIKYVHLKKGKTIFHLMGIFLFMKSNFLY